MLAAAAAVYVASQLIGDAPSRPSRTPRVGDLDSRDEATVKATVDAVKQRLREKSAMRSSRCMPSTASRASRRGVRVGPGGSVFRPDGTLERPGGVVPVQGSLFVESGIAPRPQRVAAKRQRAQAFNPSAHSGRKYPLVPPGGKLGENAVRKELLTCRTGACAAAAPMSTDFNPDAPGQFVRGALTSDTVSEGAVHQAMQSSGYFPNVGVRKGQFVLSQKQLDAEAARGGTFGPRAHPKDQPVYFVDAPARKGFERRLTTVAPTLNYGVTVNPAWRGSVYGTAGTIDPGVFD